jgi:flagellar hook-associated protein 2
MAITAAGVGSGLDVEGIISQLMVLERQPLERLQTREQEYRAELSAYGRLKSAISSFEGAMEGLSDLDKFKQFTTQSSDSDVLTASADSTAAGGVFSIDVNRLAQHHKMASDELSESATLGTAGDSIDIEIDGESMSVDFSAAMTLGEIRDAINADEDNPGLSASILNTGGGNQRLILTSDESGGDQAMTLTFNGSISGNPFGLANANRDDANDIINDMNLLDAELAVDSFTVTSGSNRVEDVIEGLTLELKETGSAELSIERDTGSIADSVQKFVDTYNNLLSTVDSLQAGDLSGDFNLRNIESQLRDVLNTSPEGIDSSFGILGELGISTQRDGKLSLDSSELEDALATDFNGVAELFANDDQGYAFRFATLAENLQSDDGVIDAREDSLNSSIEDIEKRQEDFESRLELTEQSLRSRYAALDTLLGQLQSTSSFLFQQLG